MQSFSSSWPSCLSFSLYLVLRLSLLLSLILSLCLHSTHMLCSPTTRQQCWWRGSSTEQYKCAHQRSTLWAHCYIYNMKAIPTMVHSLNQDRRSAGIAVIPNAYRSQMSPDSTVLRVDQLKSLGKLLITSYKKQQIIYEPQRWWWVDSVTFGQSLVWLSNVFLMLLNTVTNCCTLHNLPLNIVKCNYWCVL